MPLKKKIQPEAESEATNLDDANKSASGQPDDSASQTTTPSQKLPKRRLGVDPSLIISESGRSRRRRSPSPQSAQQQSNNPDPKDPARAKELGLIIYEKIMAEKDKEHVGEPLALPFVKLPSKRAFPDYYETIKHPISLEIVKEKLEAAEYQTLKDVCTDIGQIFNNAKRYNMKDSLLFQFAKKLHKTNSGKYKEESDSEGEGEQNSTSRAGTMQPEAGGSAHNDEESTKRKKVSAAQKDGPSVYKLVKPVLKAVKEATAIDGRDISAIFMQLPERKELPDYYKTIQNPISLEEIEASFCYRISTSNYSSAKQIKHHGRRYDTWEEFFDDMELMCNNAMEYNADESEVFQDAKQIKAILAHGRNDVQLRLSFPPGTKLNRSKAVAMTPLRPGQIQPPSYSASPSFIHSPGHSMTPLPHLAMASVPHIPGRSPLSHMPHTAIWPPMSQSSQSQTGFHTALLPGVVTEEIVALLERYPLHEQQAWLNSLSPQMMMLYRQVAASLEIRKHAASTGALSTPSYAHLQHQASPQLRPSSGQQTPTSQISQVSMQGKERQAPTLPIIKFIDITFSSNKLENRQILRLQNIRGLFTHSVLLDDKTSEMIITAYLDTSQVSTESPEPGLSLRLNENVVTSTKPVLSEGGRQIAAKWAISVPFQKVDNRIDILVDKIGDGTNNSIIYLSRQY
nr:hypothetical protein L203_01814 [Cryptococcus depauperatus CBS 7841]